MRCFVIFLIFVGAINAASLRDYKPLVYEILSGYYKIDSKKYSKIMESTLQDSNKIIESKNAQDSKDSKKNIESKSKDSNLNAERNTERQDSINSKRQTPTNIESNLQNTQMPAHHPVSEIESNSQDSNKNAQDSKTQTPTNIESKNLSPAHHPTIDTAKAHPTLNETPTNTAPQLRILLTIKDFADNNLTFIDTLSPYTKDDTQRQFIIAYKYFLSYIMAFEAIKFYINEFEKDFNVKIAREKEERYSIDTFYESEQDFLNAQEFFINSQSEILQSFGGELFSFANNVETERPDGARKEHTQKVLNLKNKKPNKLVTLALYNYYAFKEFYNIKNDYIYEVLHFEALDEIKLGGSLKEVLADVFDNVGNGARGENEPLNNYRDFIFYGYFKAFNAAAFALQLENMNEDSKVQALLESSDGLPCEYPSMLSVRTQNLCLFSAFQSKYIKSDVKITNAMILNEKADYVKLYIIADNKLCVTLATPPNPPNAKNVIVTPNINTYFCNTLANLFKQNFREK
ncbi:hypothetical protein DCO58_06235 [Helicobacter saguini]|uniref:Uncharacterized protein n=1 Tax=Helicobacter saguini TaxID=1548018 RepID=A0A347VTK2_9HELI|nr:hypothetical protein [Helicobacter saguini]MWV62060.1 hypothetical protein [Helicobacter saguini]MWV67266.1 hypothetical protein [Helicobacter saguini]MWV69619.1 hypothetical protein [Helicobacter saguini]MWV70830.1 hypothetical protein [Helicobacter saguini]TLD94330.1 hypothetical protein LS64_006345 [Helicobacter saguini]